MFFRRTCLFLIIANFSSFLRHFNSKASRSKNVLWRLKVWSWCYSCWFYESAGFEHHFPVDFFFKLCIYSSNKNNVYYIKAYRTLLVQNMAWILEWSWKTIKWKKKLNIIWALFSPLPIIVYMKEYKNMEACQSNEQWSASDHLILPLYWDIVV